MAERCYLLAMKTLLPTVHSNKFENMAVFFIIDESGGLDRLIIL
jgi:hypothetical protein